MIFISAIFFTCFSINTNCFRNYRNIKRSPLNKVLSDSQTQNIISSGFNTKENLQKYIKQKKYKIK